MNSYAAPASNEPGRDQLCESLNPIGIVIRLEYRGPSMLFTGDTVGRSLDDADDACKDAEQVMVDRHGAGQVRLMSDVLIASHHGANNGRATCFIKAVDPIRHLLVGTRSSASDPQRRHSCADLSGR